MKPIHFYLLAVAVLCTSTLGCGPAADPHEKLADEMMVQMNQMADTISGIKDEASAQAAKSKLESIVDSINKSIEKGNKLGDPTAEVRARIEKKMEAAQEKFQQAMTSLLQNAVANPKIMEIINPVMQKIAESQQ